MLHTKLLPAPPGPAGLGVTYYSLTRDGRRRLQDELRQWRRMSHAIERVLAVSG